MTRRVTQDRPVEWILARTGSAFADVVRDRCARGDTPTASRVFSLGRRLFGHVEFSGGRWLVLAIEPGPARGGD